MPRGEEVKSDADIHYDDGIWLLEGYEKERMLRTSIITDPADGRIPPITAEGKQRAGPRGGQEGHRPVRQRAGAQPVRALHLLGARGAANAAHRLQLERAHRPGAGHVHHPARNDAGRPHRPAGRASTTLTRASRLSRRAAGALGRRHDGHRDHQLQREDGVAQLVART